MSTIIIPMPSIPGVKTWSVRIIDGKVQCTSDNKTWYSYYVLVDNVPASVIKELE